MQMWRIAIKPGRPLALGLWNNTPVFGLPGNPVAAMVCTLVFASPAMAQLAGAGWVAPVGYDVPAKFTKSKRLGGANICGRECAMDRSKCLDLRAQVVLVD